MLSTSRRRTATAAASRLDRLALREARDRLLLGPVHVEHQRQLRDHEDVLDALVHSAQLDLPPTPHVAGARSGQADRKSTRLNSSHQIISYAVFCLKKKKKQARRE